MHLRLQVTEKGTLKRSHCSLCFYFSKQPEREEATENSSKNHHLTSLTTVRKLNMLHLVVLSKKNKSIGNVKDVIG
jgi:hypothetical protein